ncbi:putative mitochondrial integral membrane protein [Coleophoma crateriformis]|uniref:Putative mitochondrial integral membrane protein n=1 Tax=Coleophoma crateriformis TaxID=565419 RepID=A0A3D8RJG1_9HELO|nr:putative mitochondrial integral membrane protein [Coleophoma crateriformis]
MTMWGSKKDDSDDPAEVRNENGDSGEAAAPRLSEADERTHLLPPAPPREGYLSPDDPAVCFNPSATTSKLTCVTGLALQPLERTVPPILHGALCHHNLLMVGPAPGLDLRQPTWDALERFGFLRLLIYDPDPWPTHCGTAVLLDSFQGSANNILRVEEGWVGIASSVWALFISIWTIATDRVVAWGKHEEEERLTGRMETRRSLREWCAVMTSEVILIIIALVAVLLSATLILRARDSSLAAPGERYYVDGDKYQLHLFCEGNSTDVDGKKLPTVLFEAGEYPFGHGMNQIAVNALANGSISRYCYSDRPGFGWSDNAPSPFSAGMASDVLSEAMGRAGETGPWVLVSAGVGSIYSRIFSARHRHDVHGILMIDPLHEDLLHRVGAPGNGFLYWAWGVISPLGLDRIPGAIFRGRSREDRVYGRAAYQGGKYIKAKLQESLVADSLTKNEVSSARNFQSENVPLVLISSGIEIRKDTEWERKQRDLSHLTKKLVKWDIVEKAPHEVWKTLHGRQVIEKRLNKLVYA